MINYSKFISTVLTNDSITISGSEGLKSIAILVDGASTVPATVTGASDTIGGKSPAPISISAGKGISYALGNDDIDNLTITAPAGCTVYLMGAKTNVSNLSQMLLSFVGAAGGGGAISGSVNILDQLNNPINSGNPFPVEVIGAPRSSSIAGGMSVYSNSFGDFTVGTNVGTKTITITGFTLADYNLSNALIFKKTLSGGIIYISSVDLSQVSFSGQVITLVTELNNFTADDTFDVYLTGNVKGYNRVLDTISILPALAANSSVGDYKVTDYTFIAGTRKIIVYGMPYPFNYSTIMRVSNVTGINNNNRGFVIGTPDVWMGTIGFNKPLSALTAGTPTSGGSVTAGLHSYKVTFVYASGDESLESAVSNQINVTAGSNTVPLSNIPIGASGVVARNIYRTVTGDTGTYKLLTTINDNTTTTFNDTIADASLGVDVPTTTTVYDIDYSTSLPTLNASDNIYIGINILDETKDFDLGVQKTIDLASAELPPADTEPGSISDTNLATTTTTYFYEITQGLWRNLIMHLTASCSGTGGYIKLYKTYDPAAAAPSNGVGTVPSNTAWNDCTEEKMGFNEVSVIGSVSLNFCKNLSVSPDGQIVDMVDRYLLSWRPTNTSNVINANFRKF